MQRGRSGMWRGRSARGGGGTNAGASNAWTPGQARGDGGGAGGTTRPGKTIRRVMVWRSRVPFHQPVTPGLTRGPGGGAGSIDGAVGWGQSSSGYRSRHVGLCLSINASFQLLLQRFNAFSLVIAAVHRSVELVPDEGMDAVATRETLRQVVLVLPDPPDEVGGLSDVQCPVPFVGKDVDARLPFHVLLFQRSVGGDVHPTVGNDRQDEEKL